MKMAAINEDNLIAVVIKGSLGLLAVLVCVGFTLFNSKVGLGVLAGGVIAIVNFLWIRLVLQRILGLLPARPNLYAQIRFVGRLCITGLCLYLVIVSGWFSVAGLLVGLSVIVANIIALSLYSALCAGG